MGMHIYMYSAVSWPVQQRYWTPIGDCANRAITRQVGIYLPGLLRRL